MTPRGPWWSLLRWPALLALGLGALALLAPAGAQAQDGHEHAGEEEVNEDELTPELAAPVARALALEYLSEQERADLRVFHGVWTPEDLADPARRARAALVVGVWDDPSLSDPGAPVEERAEARLLRGDLDEAIDLLTGVETVRAGRIRAEALEGLGRFEEADAQIDPIVRRLSEAGASAPDLVEGVRALALRARIEGRPADDFQRMMGLLGEARNRLDRLYYPGALAEARLLIDKDNAPEADEALVEPLSMNQRSAEAWFLRGTLGVRSFSFAAVEAVARKLNTLHQQLTGEPEGVSPYASMLLARAMLRQNDPDLAEALLAPALTRHPNLREALALQCAIQAVRYDFDATETLLARFDALSPRSPLALHTVGAALSENRQYDEAAGFLERAVERQPNWPAPLIELGLLEMQSGRDERALSALRRVAELDPFNKRCANSLRLSEELLTYETVESEHFIVRYQPGVDAVMAREMLAPLERNHALVAEAFQHEPARKTLIDLMPNHRWFSVRITGMPAIHTIAASTGPVIAMEAPRIGPNHHGEYDWVRVIRHEYVHTVTLSRTKNRIPHWFTEAAAVRLELAPRDFDTCRLLAAALESDGLFDMRKINVAFVRPEKPTDRAQAYAQGHWMYEFMEERFGADAPLRLMDLYARGLREDAAMRSVLGLTQEDFLAEFREWARADVKTWGFLAEPSVDEIRRRAFFAGPEGAALARSVLERAARAAVCGVAGLGGAPVAIPDPPEPTRPLVEAWLAEHPGHPDLLALLVQSELAESGGAPTPVNAPLIEAYAAARPVDPAPHRLLALLRLSAPEGERAAAIPHLEYLDAREQDSPAFAVELARRYAGLGQWGPAGERAERATQIAPFDAGHRELAATIALQARDYDAADRHIRALIALEPDRPVHLRRLEALQRLREGG